MKINGLFIESDGDSFPIWALVVGVIASIAVAYPIGYLLIDVLTWVVLSPEQLQGGFPYVARYWVGALVIAVPCAIFMLYEDKEDN